MNITKELFIVEGESAASTVRQAMKKPAQQVIALQGKLLNTTRAPASKVLANQACRKIFTSLSCGVNDDCNPYAVPFSRVLILTDPDADGAHARALLLALFDNYLRPVVNAGMVYAVIPPLFRIITGDPLQTCYAWDEPECRQLARKLAKDNDVAITRIKGIAQFANEECAQLLLRPESRSQIRLSSEAALPAAVDI